MSRAAYARHRTRQIAYGRWQPYVDAAPIRQRIRDLLNVGIGGPQLQTLCGVCPQTIYAILHGTRHRVRPGTAARIMAVPVTTDIATPRAYVDATGTIRRLQALVAAGWSQVRIARELGVDRGNFVRLMTQAQVTAATARAVSDLYTRLWDVPPPAGTGYERNGRRIALLHAAERGWVPPAAWDDDEIDDPAARPRCGGRERAA